MLSKLPAAALTVRAGNPAPEGTSVAPQVTTEWPLPGLPFVPTETTVIFIHGYNNAHAEARYKYAVFRDLIHQGFGVTTPVIEFHWPGNERWGFLSFLSYPTEVQAAIGSGQRLAAWIASLAPNARLIAVTHSMGGRVLLETVRTLRAQGAADRLVGACMMAGAVRVDQVAAGTLGPITGEAMRWRVLFSGADKVLHYAFPIGQTAAKDGVFPTAVGRAGQPLAKWDSVDSPGYDHGYYWFGGKPDKKQPQSDDKTTPLTAPLYEMAPLKQGDDVSPNSVAAFLGFATPNQIPAAAGPQENQIATNAVASSAIGAHQLGS